MENQLKRQLLSEKELELISELSSITADLIQVTTSIGKEHELWSMIQGIINKNEKLIEKIKV